jgi:hypothetical protein
MDAMAHLICSQMGMISSICTVAHHPERFAVFTASEHAYPLLPVTALQKRRRRRRKKE